MRWFKRLALGSMMSASVVFAACPALAGGYRGYYQHGSYHGHHKHHHHEHYDSDDIWAGVAIGLGAALLFHLLHQAAQRPPAYAKPSPQAVYPPPPALYSAPDARAGMIYLPPTTRKVWRPGYYGYRNYRSYWVPGRWEVEKLPGLWLPRVP